MDRSSSVREQLARQQEPIQRPRGWFAARVAKASGSSFPAGGLPERESPEWGTEMGAATELADWAEASRAFCRGAAGLWGTPGRECERRNQRPMRRMANIRALGSVTKQHCHFRRADRLSGARFSVQPWASAHGLAVTRRWRAEARHSTLKRAPRRTLGMLFHDTPLGMPVRKAMLDCQDYSLRAGG
jgi:hypothetical protein